MSSIPKLVELVVPQVKPWTNCKGNLMERLCQRSKLLSIPTDAGKNISNVGGEKSYALLGSLAKLEKALMKWSLNELVSKHKFTPVIVPNIIHDDVVERCGFPTKSSRSQVYKISSNTEDCILNPNDKSSDNRNQSCIAGTSEFALASIHIGDSIPAVDLPLRYCALSRCYRAETSNTHSEWGLYRVHYFNKVEMVALVLPSESEKMHEELLEIQKDLFTQLGLQFQVLDMPKSDLGLSATKKYDVEAWLSGRGRYGEISSTSNCTDYQSSRLNIRYSKLVEGDDQLQVENGFVHTLNGTACSSIRTMIALIEQHQNEKGKVDLPKTLVPFMDGVTSIPTMDDERLLAEMDLYSSCRE